MREMATRQAADGHEVTILTARYPGSAQREDLEGVHIIRLSGSRYLQPAICLWYYLRYLRGKFDIIIEAVNTAPYFSPYFRGKARSYLLYHQLAREIWYYETPLPLAFVGYFLLEPVATWLLAMSGATTITVSESTRQDLVRFGFREDNIFLISEGIPQPPVANLHDHKKFDQPSILSHGAMRPMKRTLHQLQAFEIAKRDIPELQLYLSGDTRGRYGKKVLRAISASPYRDSIHCLGRTSDAKKIQLMRRCHIKLQTATKEGWGITVTEANSQGTPAIVYDADGLRDSVRHDDTGIITECSPPALARAIVELFEDPHTYRRLRSSAWRWSHDITFDKGYRQMRAIIEA